jgi:hypothetical protein
VALPVVEDLDELEQVGVASARVSNQIDPRIQAISTLSRAQKVSIAALSYASPVDPNDRVHVGVAGREREVQRRVDRSLVGVVDHLGGVPVRASAIVSADTTRAASWRPEVSQPTIPRWNRSRIPAR